MSKRSSKKPEVSEEQLRKGQISMERFNEMVGRVFASREFASPKAAESYVNDIISGKRAAPPPTTKLEIAQEMAFDAMEESDPERRAAIARKALAISEDCADAWMILAEHTESEKKERELLEKAVKAGERAIGPERFKEETGYFWSAAGTRPYMRARRALASSLWWADEQQPAIAHLQDMLRLNPNDNQGVRDDLAGWLAETGDHDALRRLLDEYKDDHSATLEYARALLAFRQEGDSGNARKRLRAAYRANRFVPQYLLGLKDLPKNLPEFVTMGGESEAAASAVHLLACFAKDPGAAEWLIRFMSDSHQPEFDRLMKRRLALRDEKSAYPMAETPARRTMNESQPVLEEWRRLYDAATRFQALECWKWLYDSDLFGVMNPETREIGYCSVMGNLGTFFALGVYKGSEGFVAYNRTLAAGLRNDPREAMFSQNCLMAEFENTDELDEPDRAVMRRLGMEVTSGKRVPMFRSYRPGFTPWFVNTDEARFLTYALEQAVEVVTRFRDSTRELEFKPGPAFLTRVPEGEPEARVWHDAWLVPVVPEPEPKPRDFPVNEVRMTRVKRAGYTKVGIWEADFCYSPFPIQEKHGKRPYFPYQYLIADHESGTILTVHAGEPDTVVLNLREQFFNACEKANVLPAEVQVRTEEALRILQPLASGLGIEIKRVKELPVVERVIAKMEEEVMAE